MIRATRSLLSAATLALAVTTAGITGAQAATTSRHSAGHVSSPVHWSHLVGPVPGATTSRTPALAAAMFPARKAGVVLLWDGPRLADGAYRLEYATTTNVPGDKWSAPATVGKALAAGPPAAAVYGDPSAGQVIAVWAGDFGVEISYDIGTAGAGGVVTWGPIFSIPGTAASLAPAVFRPLNSDAIFVAWKAAGSFQVKYVEGVPSGGPTPVAWGSIHTLPRAATSASPAVTELPTGKHSGQLYVLWKGTASTDRIYFSWTPEPLSAKAHWSKPVAVRKAKTKLSPAAIALAPARSKAAAGPRPGLAQRLCPFCEAFLPLYEQGGVHYDIETGTGSVGPPYPVPGLGGSSQPPAAGAGWVAATKASGVYLTQPSW
jgi:hypothetical protein